MRYLAYVWYWLCDAWDVIAEIFDRYLGYFLLLGCATLIAGLIYIAYLDSMKPTFTLKKDEWTCTAEVTETHLQPVLINKTTVMLPRTETERVRWEKRQ